MLVRQLGRSDATTQSKSAIAQQEEILDRMDAIKDKKQAIATKRDELLAKRDSIMQGANDQHQHDTQNDVESLMEDLEQAQIASPPPPPLPPPPVPRTESLTTRVALDQQKQAADNIAGLTKQVEELQVELAIAQEAAHQFSREDQFSRDVKATQEAAAQRRKSGRFTTQSKSAIGPTHNTQKNVEVNVEPIDVQSSNDAESLTEELRQAQIASPPSEDAR